ncbi:fungal-specific transcription factor domain-containing protein [Corynascus similis CBS 632.67]
MPPKRRVAETETSHNLNGAPFGQAETALSAAQPAPVKRQRVSRACDQCRAARERCDGKQPHCQSCISQNRPCSYDVSPKKRGVQTGYIRTLELTLGWVLEKVPGSEETLGALLAQDGGHGVPILAGRDPGGADRLQKRWRKSRVHRRIDRILSGEAAAPSPEQHGLSPSADASDTEGNQIRARLESDSAAPDATSVMENAPNLRRRSFGHCPPSTEQPRQSSSDGMYQHPEAPSGRVRLPSNHWRLLDIYFSYTHSWLPILEKQDLFQASYVYPDEGLAIDPRDKSSAIHAALWAALALASFQDAGSSKPSSGQANPSKLPAGKIYEIARGLLPLEQESFQIHHAQAFLLLSLVNLGQDKLTGAGLLIGSATRILLASDTAQHGTPDQDSQRARLALMSCFMLDTILSVRYGSPPHLRPQDLAAMSPVSETGPDQWEPWTPCDGFGLGDTGYCSSRSPAFRLSTFNQLYAIIKILAEEVSMRRQGTMARDSSSTFVPQLQQAINPNLPFSNFVLSPSCGAFPVPTPYMVRATYLWASALIEPHRAATLLPLLQDTLGQYQRLFGRPSTPPILYTCVASLENEDYTSRCGKQGQDSLRSLVSAFSFMPFGGRLLCTSRRSRPNPASPRTQDPLSPTSPHTFGPGDSLANYQATFMPSLYNNSPIRAHRQPHPTSRDYNSFSGRDMRELYQSHYPNSTLTISQNSDTRAQRPENDMAAMSGVSAAAASSHGEIPPPSYHLIPHTGLGPNPDVDALLDDLASIEYTDAADADPQFMANLGFAPGCDITEILTRGFGGA